MQSVELSAEAATGRLHLIAKRMRFCAMELTLERVHRHGGQAYLEFAEQHLERGVHGALEAVSDDADDADDRGRRYATRASIIRLVPRRVSALTALLSKCARPSA